MHSPEEDFIDLSETIEVDENSIWLVFTIVMAAANKKAAALAANIKRTEP